MRRVPRPLASVTLTGRHVVLEPLRLDHVDDLVEAATADRSTYDLSPVPADESAMTAYVRGLLADHAATLVLPFAQVDAVSGRAVGCTRYLDLRWWRGRDEPDEVEIGGTWLAARAQRTGINTEAKRLLLGYAFESLGVWRVAICTDERNARSRAAIERIGGTFEGVLRNHRVRSDSPDPSPRQTAVYSVVEHEWPAVRDALDARLAG